MHKTTTTGLENHHVMNGPMKKKSEKWGGLIWLCSYHHTAGGKNCIHENRELKDEVKADFQRAFELINGHDLWMREFKKNYKED